MSTEVTFNSIVILIRSTNVILEPGEPGVGGEQACVSGEVADRRTLPAPQGLHTAAGQGCDSPSPPRLSENGLAVFIMVTYRII